MSRTSMSIPDQFRKDADALPSGLRFNTDNRSERKAVFVELCEKAGVDPTAYL